MSSEIEPADPTPPAPPASQTDGSQPAAPRKTFGGLLFGILNFVTLTARFMALATAAMWLKENLHLLKDRMHRDAEQARRISEMCGQAGVDPYFQGLAIEASQALDRVAEASGELAGAADGMEANARAVGDAHETEYRGIYEVRQASPYAQPKPGFNTVR
ncbi:hypothetical protein [Streptomyces seoulensis]|uniref:hypothetical protein n=1 Tax=Streptomyces seoulensis TaxID=73044 RepID=UPI000691FA94|nr:hypothetical protein [Streptomyces seoulensis]